MRTCLPVLVNEMSLLIKASPAVAVAGIVDVTRAAVRIGAETYRPLPLLLVALFIDAIIVAFFVLAQRNLERRRFVAMAAVSSGTAMIVRSALPLMIWISWLPLPTKWASPATPRPGWCSSTAGRSSRPGRRLSSSPRRRPFHASSFSATPPRPPPSQKVSGCHD
jgi:hypothetical protein